MSQPDALTRAARERDRLRAYFAALDRLIDDVLQELEAPAVRAGQEPGEHNRETSEGRPATGAPSSPQPHPDGEPDGCPENHTRAV